MKNWILFLSLCSLAACASIGSNAVSSRVPANTVNTSAVATALDGKLADKSSLDKDGNILLASASNSRRDHQVWMEDCRKVSLRQAILDASLQGGSDIQLSRKASHRIAAIDAEDHVMAMIGVRMKSGSGSTLERTYSYILNDPSNGQCLIAARNTIQEGFQARSLIEQAYAQNLIAKDPGAARSAAKTAAKNVDKLIKSDCEQNSLNTALTLASQLYGQKYATNPIVALDFRRSNTRWSDQDSGTQKGQFSGHWAFVMMDKDGKNSIQARVGFQLQSVADDQCSGTTDSVATEFVD